MFDGHLVADGDPLDVFDNELLSDVYSTDVFVEWHETLERLVVHV